MLEAVELRVTIAALLLLRKTQPYAAPLDTNRGTRSDIGWRNVVRRGAGRCSTRRRSRDVEGN
jgi:hypothetical protein